MKQVVLYNHNKTTYENITKIFENDNKCAVVQPTGSGKSFLIFKLAQDNSDKTIVVFEPNKQIIGRVSKQMKEYGIENIQFYTYQKLNSQHKRDDITIDNVDYICLDELHRIKAKQWGKAVDAIRDRFPNAKVLGLTATPERMDGQNIVDYFGAELACNITLGDAIINKILPCPTYISALYTFDEEVQKVYNKINESRNSDEEKDEMRAELEAARKQLENALGVPKILKKHISDKNGKYIVFCQSVEHLNTMRSVIEDWFTNAGFEIHTYAVYTKNPNRKVEYKKFQTDNSDCIKLCLCIDMFNEGVHLEGITGVILLRPTQSNIIYFQQIGRAISASDENTPIIFDFVNNGNCLGCGSFKIEIELSVNKQKESIKNQKSNNEVFDIGDFYIYDYITESLNIFSNIENKCVDDFEFRLKQLGEYKDKWGHCCVFKEKSKDWDGLYKWAKDIRTNYNGRGLSSNKVEALNRHEFIWDNEVWKFYNLTLPHIKQYFNDGNKLPIPAKYVCKDGFNLGMRLKSLKKRKVKNKINNNIENELIKMGIDLSFVSLEDNWIKTFNVFKEYIKLYNKPVTPKTEYKGYKIGIWISNNKQKYINGRLPKYRENLLREIYDLDFNSHDNRYKIWNEKYRLLKEYIDLGNTLKNSSVYNNVNLGRWYNSQFVLYKQGKLENEKIEKLKMLNLLRFPFDQKWEELFAALKSCVDNKINITWHTIHNNIKVGTRLSGYKSRYKKGEVSNERYQQLLAIGIDLAKEGSIM